MSENIQLNNEVTEIQNDIQLLDLSAKLTIKDLSMKINEIIDKLNTITELPNSHKPRNRGPASQRQMTENDAERVMLGDLKDLSHMKAAEELGLSYGQIYSARKGFCFKPTYQKMIKIQNN